MDMHLAVVRRFAGPSRIRVIRDVARVGKIRTHVLMVVDIAARTNQGA